MTLGETSGLNILFVCTKVHYEQLCWQQGQVLCTWPMNTVCHRATSNNCLCSSVFFCIVLSASRMKVQRSHSSLQKVFLAQNSVIHHKHIPQWRPTAAANLLQAPVSPSNRFLSSRLRRKPKREVFKSHQAFNWISLVFSRPVLFYTMFPVMQLQNKSYNG